MLSSSNKVAPIVLALAIIISISAFVYSFKSSQKTSYVNITEVFNQFDFKKQMEKKYLTVKQSRDRILDSLKFNLQAISNRLNTPGYKNDTLVTYFNFKKDEFYQKSNIFESDNLNYSKQLDAEVLSQLNQYMKDYGKEYNYDFIFGTDGNGSIMYAVDSRDVTKEVVAYINLKYKGVK